MNKQNPKENEVKTVKELMLRISKYYTDSYASNPYVQPGLPTPEMLGIYNCKKTGALTLEDLIECL